MAPSTFCIILDKPNASYFPGEVVSGRVILEFDQEKNTQGLKLKFKGEAEVGWQEQGQNSTRGYHDTETYFHTKIVLVGDEKNTDVTIPTGRQEYPFRFQLPLNLPSSFESQFGNVRYDIEAVVKRSWKFDYCTKILFSVNALVDLNLQPAFVEPMEASKEKSICCLCCKEGPISMRVKIPRSGYVPGESIKFSVECNNSSSRPVSAIMVYFCREVAYRAPEKTKRVTNELWKAKGPEVKPFLSETWEDQVLVPPIPPTNLGGCKIIALDYTLKFKLDIPSSVDLKKKLPVHVGTIPYKNFLPEHSPLPPSPIPEKVGEIGEIKNDPSAPPHPILSQYPDMPLPGFQDAVDDGSKSENASPCLNSRGTTPVPGDADYRFTPKYATYNYGWKFSLNVPDQNGV